MGPGDLTCPTETGQALCEVWWPPTPCSLWWTRASGLTLEWYQLCIVGTFLHNRAGDVIMFIKLKFLNFHCQVSHSYAYLNENVKTMSIKLELNYWKYIENVLLTFEKVLDCKIMEINIQIRLARSLKTTSIFNCHSHFVLMSILSFIDIYR